MAELPLIFTEQTRKLMGDERFERYLRAFEEEPPVSIRLNPKKAEGLSVADGEQVPWCRGGYYLPQRPNFTMDPLLHAGCYYVQEAASMFLDEVLHQMHNAYVNHQPSAIRPQTALDLCAAPGGKSTLLRSALPGDCVLYSNEPIRNRASILLENVTKWGYENHHVTNCYPRDYRRAKQPFDLILCDVPCSGEGMFRKDPATIREWSPQNVEKCWQLQREIVSEYIVRVPLILRRTRRTSAGCWRTLRQKCCPLRHVLNGTLRVRCSKGSTNLSIVSSPASRVARGYSCVC